MKALIEFHSRRIALLIISIATIVCFMTIESTSTALAKARPPVEMGDPDDTGNQASLPGPTSQPKFFSSPVVLRGEVFRGSVRGQKTSILWYVVSGPLAFWLRNI